MTVMIGDDPAAPEPLTDEEEAAMQSFEALSYRLAVLLMRLDGNDGDPHHLLWEGGPVPEPWGDAWQRYEPQALSVIDTIGEASARAMTDALEKVIPVPWAGPAIFMGEAIENAHSAPCETRAAVAASNGQDHPESISVGSADSTRGASNG